MSSLSEAESDCDKFFRETQPPDNLAATEARVQDWVSRHALQGRRVALVTSGGTSVPLERLTVR